MNTVHLVVVDLVVVENVGNNRFSGSDGSTRMVVEVAESCW